MEHIQKRRAELQKSILSTYGVEPSSENVITEEELVKSYGQNFVTENNLKLYKQNILLANRRGEMSDEDLQKSQEEVESLERKVVVGKYGKQSVWVKKAEGADEEDKSDSDEDKEEEAKTEEGEGDNDGGE